MQISNSQSSASPPRRAAQRSPFIDLTPMVDLAFLLITFFMLTTSMRKSYTLEIDQPSISTEPQVVAACQIMQFILCDEYDIYYYEGMHAADMVKLNKDTTYLPLLPLIIDKIHRMKHECNAFRPPHDTLPVILIKSSPTAAYPLFIYTMEEVVSSGISTYALQDILPEEMHQIMKIP